MPKEKSFNVSCRPKESPSQSTEDSVGMDNEEELNTRSIG